MRVLIALTFLFLLALPGSAAAQRWREAALFAVPGTASAQAWKLALERGDEVAAVRLLSALVFEPDEIFPPADDAEQLATLYLEGRGVPQDTVLACSLLDLASRSARFRSRSEQPNTRLERRRDEACQPLSADDRLEAGRLMGCVTFGPEPQSYALDAGHWVEISRQGIRLHHDNADTLHDLPGVGCRHQFLPVRYTRVPTSDPPGSRHFLELFSSFSRSCPMKHRALICGSWWRSSAVRSTSVLRRC